MNLQFMGMWIDKLFNAHSMKKLDICVLLTCILKSQVAKLQELESVEAEDMLLSLIINLGLGIFSYPSMGIDIHPTQL